MTEIERTEILSPSASSSRALVALSMSALLGLGQALAQEPPPRDPAALALAYEQAALSSARWGASYYQKLATLAPRFGQREAEVRAWARHFLRRCQSVAQRPAAANEPAVEIDEADLAWAAPELARWLKNWTPGAASLTMTGAAKRADIQALLERDEAWAEFALSGTEDSAKGMSPGPDFELVLSRELIGEREVAESLRFYDPGRCLQMARALARWAKADASPGPIAAEAAAVLACLRGEKYENKDNALSGVIQALHSGDFLQLEERLLASRDPAWIIQSARWRARSGLALEEAEAILEAEWQKRQNEARPGPAGRRRLMVEGRPLIQGLALLRLARAQAESESNQAGLRALALMDWLFAPGTRGELASEDLRLGLDLGDIYMQAHRTKEALLYIYDGEAALGALPHASSLRHFAGELALMDALMTNDASRDELLGEPLAGLRAKPLGLDAIQAAQDASAGSSAAGREAPSADAPPRNWRGWLVAGAGLALLILAVSRGLRS